jgi:hypothetical protein
MLYLTVYSHFEMLIVAARKPRNTCCSKAAYVSFVLMQSTSCIIYLIIEMDMHELLVLRHGRTDESRS